MKNKLLRILSYVLVAVAASALTLVFTLQPEGKLRQLEQYLLHYHVDGADKTALEDAAAHGMVSALSDRWSYYIPADEYQSYLDNKNNAYVGIGVTVTWQETGYLVSKVAEGGPAQQAGILPGDLINRVDGKLLADLTAETADDLILGEEGSSVQIGILREGQERSFTVTRQTVKVQVAVGTLLSDNIGLVKIHNFNSSCSSETIAAIESLRSQGAAAIIFDVRFNGGGYATEMIELLDYLLPEGVLFRTEDYKGHTEVKTSDADFLDMPMAVLVNGSSYSAAEFFAAALSEYDAAVVVGEQTSGKGYFQNTFALMDGSAVAISTGKYCTPNGVSLEGVGITPEISVAVDAETAANIYAGTLQPEDDPQILAAINALKSAK